MNLKNPDETFKSFKSPTTCASKVFNLLQTLLNK